MERFVNGRIKILTLLVSVVFMACTYRNDDPVTVANNRLPPKIKSMISTKDLSALPDRKMLQKVADAHDIDEDDKNIQALQNGTDAMLSIQAGALSETPKSVITLHLNKSGGRWRIIRVEPT